MTQVRRAAATASVGRVILVAVGVIALLIIAGVLLGFRNLTGAGATYHVSVGAPTPGNPGAPEHDGTVTITVNGRAVAPRVQYVDFPYGRNVSVRPGERIIVIATSKNRPVTCTISTNPGPGMDTVAYSDPSAQDPSTGEWRGGCSWTRPS